MKDLETKATPRKESVCLFYSKNNLSDEGKPCRHVKSKETFKHIRNMYSSKTKKVNDSEDFYDAFLSKLKKEETKDQSTITKDHRMMSPKRVHIKSKDSSHNHHKSSSPNIDLNNIVQRVFEGDTTEERSKINHQNKISNIIQPLYKENIKISKTYKHNNSEYKILNKYYKYESEKGIIEKESTFLNKLMCCFAFKTKHSS